MFLSLITTLDVEADEVDDDDVWGKGSPCCCFQVYYCSGEMNTDVDKGILCRYTYWIQMNLNIVICGKAGPQRGQPNCTTWLLHGQNWSDPASKPWTKNRSYSLWHQSFHYFHKTQFISIFNISRLILMNIHIQILLMMYNTLLFILINVMTLNQVIISNFFIQSITPTIHLTDQCVASVDTELM